MARDILNLKPTERTIEMKDPADENRNIGIRVRLMAITDERMKKIRRSIQDAALANNAKGKHFKSDDVENNQNALLFAAMLGWEWYNPTGKKGDEGFDADAQLEFEKNPNPEFNKRTVFAILTQLEWFADQIAEEIKNEKEFFTNSKSN